MTLMLFMSEGGGIDLETAAAYAEKNNSATTSTASITIPSKVGISSPYLAKPIKIEIPASMVTASTSKPIVMKGIGSLNTADGKQIRFIPPKVNTANNRVPAGPASGGSGEDELKRVRR